MFIKIVVDIFTCFRRIGSFHPILCTTYSMLKLSVESKGHSFVSVPFILFLISTLFTGPVSMLLCRLIWRLLFIVLSVLVTFMSEKCSVIYPINSLYCVYNHSGFL